jgi:hypothetical protein
MKTTKTLLKLKKIEGNEKTFYVHGWKNLMSKMPVFVRVP